MTRSALAAVGAAALLVLTLTGCSFTSETVSVTAEPGTTVSEGGVTITSEDDADLTPDEQFLAALDGRLTAVALTDAELFAAGESACGGLSAGVAAEDLHPIEGAAGEFDADNALIVQAAIDAYCPEYQD